MTNDEGQIKRQREKGKNVKCQNPNGKSMSNDKIWKVATGNRQKEQKMKNFFSRRARRVRREDPRRNKLQDHAGTFWNFSFPVSPVTSSAAGERKAFAFG